MIDKLMAEYKTNFRKALTASRGIIFDNAQRQNKIEHFAKAVYEWYDAYSSGVNTVFVKQLYNTMARSLLLDLENFFIFGKIDTLKKDSGICSKAYMDLPEYAISIESSVPLEFQSKTSKCKYAAANFGQFFAIKHANRRNGLIYRFTITQFREKVNAKDESSDGSEKQGLS